MCASSALLFSHALNSSVNLAIRSPSLAQILFNFFRITQNTRNRKNFKKAKIKWSEKKTGNLDNNHRDLWILHYHHNNSKKNQVTARKIKKKNTKMRIWTKKKLKGREKRKKTKKSQRRWNMSYSNIIIIIKKQGLFWFITNQIRD